MNIFIYCFAIALFTLSSLPLTAEAFSRRSHHSDVGPSQAVTAPLNNTNQTENSNISPQAVPEPPVVLLMSIGVGLIGLYSIVKRYRREC